MRIGIVSNAGRGSSILAEQIAKEYSLSCLLNKSITGPILKRDGFDFSSGQRVESFLSTLGRQREIFEATKAQHEQYTNFVTDRTFIGLATYHLIELNMRIPIDGFIQECKEMSKIYTHVFFIPWSGNVLNNKKRTVNPWYQFAVSAVSEKMAEYFGIYLHYIRSEGDLRMQEVRDVLK